MKIKFKERQACICLKYGGFAGQTIYNVLQVSNEVGFDIVKIEEKDDCCVNIFVRADDCIDGYGYFLMNVPRTFFEVVEE